MSYLSLTDADRAEMLAAIGVSSIDDLFEQIPSGVRLERELDVLPALGEAELARHLEELAAKSTAANSATASTCSNSAAAAGHGCSRSTGSA